MLTSLVATLTALAAQVSIRLPFTPVPVTGQVFMVLLAGGLLGARLGAASQLQYLALGAMGLPVFAGGASGLIAFSGPSGGYLFGFVAAAWVTGKLSGASRSWWRLLCAGTAGVGVIYLFGAGWLACWLALFAPAPNLLELAFRTGVKPFIAIDLAKALAVAQLLYPLRLKTGTGKA
jgi:biotin transport system substrate-specific component